MPAITYTISMTFEDGVKAQEILDAFCEEHGFTSGNKQVFLKQEVIEFVKLPWIRKRRRSAQQAADTSVTIT